MTRRDNYYNLIGTLHDQLEDIETYQRYLKDGKEDAEAVRIWTFLRDRAEEAVLMIRQEIQARSAAGEGEDDTLVP